MNDPSHEFDDDAPDTPDTLPPALVDALRAMDGPEVMPSAEHDDALLAGARAHLAKIGGDTAAATRPTGGSRHVLAFLGAGGAVAAAAAVVLVVWINGNKPATDAGPIIADNNPTDSWRSTDTGTDPQQPADENDNPHGIAARPDLGRTPLPGGDLDGSGTVDILDAFALARAIEHDGPATRDRASDFNRDGRVDQHDADWLADRAVALKRDGGRG